MQYCIFVTNFLFSKATVRQRAWYSATLLLVSGYLFTHQALAQATDNPLLHDPMLVQQRALYQQAVQAQSRGQSTELQTLMAQLEDYPLTVYLEFNALRPSLSALAQRGNHFTPVDDFLSRHGDSFLGNRLEREWVSALAKPQSSLSKKYLLILCTLRLSWLARGSDLVIRDRGIPKLCVIWEKNMALAFRK
jgi:hypothetical protein